MPKRLLIALPVALPLAAAAAVIAFVARRVIHPVRARPTQILAVENDTVTLTANPLTRTAGVLGLLYDDEQRLAVLTPDVDLQADGTTVRRRLQSPSDPELAPGPGRATGNVFASPQDVDSRVVEVPLITDLGLAPAWVFPGDSATAQTWLIHIHGSLSGREGALRSVDALRSTGFPSIVPSFRGDGEGPPAPRGAFMLGQAEWGDVEPALAYALEHGAQRLVLIGWSVGATIALRLAATSKYRHAAVGVIAISPVLDWTHAVELGLQHAHLPKPLARVALRALCTPVVSLALGAPQSLHWSALTAERPAAPTLLLHSPSDQTAPFADSRSYQAAHPAVVELPPIPAASHALEWNISSRQFEELVYGWLDIILEV